MSAWLVWFLVGIGFLILELILPGFIVIFFCMGAWVAMLAVLVAPDLGTAGQVILFVVASLASLFTLRKWGMKTFHGRSEINEDARIDDKIGKPAVVTQAIAPHAPGEIKCLGSFWRAVADVPLAAGKPVIIESQASKDGLTFKVKPAE